MEIELNNHESTEENFPEIVIDEEFEQVSFDCDESTLENINYLRKRMETDSSIVPIICKILWKSSKDPDINEAVELSKQYYTQYKELRDYLIEYYIQRGKNRESLVQAIKLLETYPDSSRLLDLVKLYWEEGSDSSLEKMLKILDGKTIVQYPETSVYLAKLFEYGKIVDLDYGKAEKLLRYAMSSGVSQATNELIGVLWKKSDPESIAEMHRILPGLLMKKSRNAFAYLGRSYRDGRGIDIDLIKAADCFRQIQGINIGWDCELYDILVKIGTKETKHEARAILERYRGTKDSRVLQRRKKLKLFVKI